MTPRTVGAAVTATATATALALGVPLAAPLAVQAHPGARAARATRVTARRTAVGTILADSRGFTLYAFTRDDRSHNRCAPQAGCSGVWPALTTSGRPLAGRGVHRARLGTIRIAGGRTQVTYAGHPLYRYAADSGPGQTAYVGVSSYHGTWKAVRTSGALKG